MGPVGNSFGWQAKNFFLAQIAFAHLLITILCETKMHLGARYPFL
jgi:hypothetical protein